MKIREMMSAVALVSGLMASTGAQARSCWSRQAVEAAQIHEFDIMLMVSALRCQVKGMDFVPDYNRFVAGNRATLVAASDEIRHHFNAEMGGRAALDAYDHMGTAMANRYGNGGGFTEDCEELRAMTIAATAVSTDSTRAFLLARAQRVGMDPALDGGRCDVAVAVTIAQAAAPAPAPQLAGQVAAPDGDGTKSSSIAMSQFAGAY